MIISLRVIDGATGRSASGISVRVERCVQGDWTEQARERTDGNGTVTFSTISPAMRGVYRLILDTDAYFVTLGFVPPFPSITVELRKLNAELPLRVLVVVTMHAYFVCQEI
jgi:5-hydroxyisourate hydrolase